MPQTLRSLITALTLTATAAASPATAAAQPKPASVLVATQTSYGSTGWDERMFVHRVGPAGIERLASFNTGGGAAFGWSDAHTLWLASGTAEGTTVRKYVDGVLAGSLEVGPASWRTPLNEEQKTELPTLRITKTGEVWLELCLARKHFDVGPSRCRKTTYNRVDTGALVYSTKPPRSIDLYRATAIYQDGAPLRFPKTKPPTGYAVTLRKVTVDGLDATQRDITLPGAVCTGPGQQTITWPDRTEDLAFAMKPRTVTWLHAAPALARLTGDAINPIGQRERHEAFLFECKEHVAAAEYFGGDLWGILRAVPVEEWQKTKTPDTDGTWSLYRGDTLLGTVPGSEIRLAPH